MLDAEWDKYQQLLTDGLDQEDALKKMGLSKLPLTGRELLEKLKAIWEAKEIRDLKGLLIFYASQVSRINCFRRSV